MAPARYKTHILKSKNRIKKVPDSNLIMKEDRALHWTDGRTKYEQKRPFPKENLIYVS